jgi:phosphatidylinositol-bisphosphatase
VALRVNYQPNPTSVSPSPLPITFTFVNSHLAAFDDHIDHRNTDFQDISRRLKFGPCSEYMWAPRTKHREARPRKLSIYASDVLLWLVSHPDNRDYHHVPNVYMIGRYTTVGISPWSFRVNEFFVIDLNYRLNLPDADVRHMLYPTPTTQGIHSLLQFDEVRSFDHCDGCPFQLTLLLQLKNSIRHSRAFTRFHEHPITFLPSGVLV